ncbi:hypothetical protein NECAME_10495 [Necator americanus]|uniref:Uncharacterized protein n=1 Tax=Necator americanus TaxID=51031 RepID=W2TB19_NECAM|nr:hypothetical protein NECAME_10495 [Necator americanus]ETN78212.1 hypothetical protein NECAME_10495 [Necator americanus]
MDGAWARDLYTTVAGLCVVLRFAATSRRVVAVASKALGLGPARDFVSADLGGSSKYLSAHRRLIHSEELFEVMTTN